MSSIESPSSLSEAERVCPLSQISFTAAPEPMQLDGLRGWVRFTVLGGLVVRDVALRRSRDGREYLAYPKRSTAKGAEHCVVSPSTDRMRAAIELQVFAALALARSSDHVADDRAR